METRDFTGVYDYEKTEAEHAANYLLEELSYGSIDEQEFFHLVEKERIHWKKHLPDTWEDFDQYFIAKIQEGLKCIQSGS
jgi:hypothetical protein